MILTSPDGQWAVVKRGREVTLLAGGGGPAVAQLELPTADTDLVLVGPPNVVAAVSRGGDGDGERCNRLVLYMPPSLEAVARHDLDAPMRIAAVTGSRLVLVSLDGKAVSFVRVAGRALAAQPIDTGSPVEFVVGLERNQVLFSLLRKLESWDAVSGRPLQRVQLPLPPPPRIVGPAHGHLWLIRPGGQDILVVRLSDGRPFHHAVGVPIDDVIYHASSPLLVLVTARGLVRLQCYAHSLMVIDAPWQPGMQLGQLVVGEDISLLGIAERDEEPWRIPIGGAGAPAATPEAAEPGGEPMVTAADKLRAMRERSAPEPSAVPERPQRGLRLDLGERTGGVRLDLGERTGGAPRFDFGDRPPRSDGADVTQTAELGATGETGDRAEHSDRFDAGYRPERPERPEHGAAGDIGQRTRSSEHAATGQIGHRAEHGDRLDAGRPPERSDRFDAGYRSDRAERPDVSEPAMAPTSAAVPTEIVAASAASSSGAVAPRHGGPRRGATWRDVLAGYGGALVSGAAAELPAVAAAPDIELGRLALRLALPDAARRALAALYSAYLIGEPMVPLARLAQALGDWTEVLGQGELAALVMLRRRGGKAGLRGAVCNVLDGATPRGIRLVGDDAAVLRPGAARLAREGRSDEAIESVLVGQLGRIAVIDGAPASALLEARLHGATAVALAAPASRPLPWPRDTGLVVVAESTAPAWVAALPALTVA
jgi:hypothetical protein